ncbi:MAG: PilZ domain-containing protein [Fimbriimonadaceae bacterium]|nr:PilZ domain-containing protein [Fimbriimonadaceae bacterium]
MEPVNGSQHAATPGSEVGIIFYEDATPHALTSTVVSVRPFAATCSEPASERLKPGQRVMLVLESDGKYAKAEAEIAEVVPDGDGWRIQVGHFGWEEVDRRRFPRHPIEASVSLRSVIESEDGVEVQHFGGKTEDISLGGVWVVPDRPLTPGALVEINMTLGTQPVRILAIVARDAGRGGVGLEFLDYVGGARYYLHGFLNKGEAA